MELERRAVSNVAVVGILIVAFVVVGAAYLLSSQGGTGGQSTTSQTTLPTTTSSSSSTSSTAASYRVVMEMQAPTPLASSDTVANYTLQVTLVGTPTAPLTVAATGPTGVTIQASPAQIQPDTQSSSVSLSFKVASIVAASTYTFNVTVSSSGQVDTQKFNVEVVKYLVVMIGQTYQPANITVPVGSTVYWMRLNGALSQYDNGDHDVVFSTLSAYSPTLAQYQFWSYAFSQAGNFAYHCSFHSSMTGQVNVS